MSQRAERVAGVLLKEISRVLREEIHNSQIGFVTLLKAEVTNDLRLAKVYYSVLGSDEEKKRSDIQIRNASKYIKRLVNENIRLRYAIDLQFIRETSIDNSIRIQNILDRIQKEREDDQQREGM